MIERTNFLNPFWVLMVVLIVGLTLFGGFIAWKLLHSATPQIERAQMDPEQLLEQTIAASPDSQAGQTSGDFTQQQGTSTYTQTGIDYTYWDDETENVPATSTKAGSKQTSSQTATKQVQSATSSQKDMSSAEEDFSYRLEDLPAPKP
ncbi:MAG: hypothetical protein IKW71_01305, partial [Elusimicrobiaceae bacterium]|nr:hypothetical protein [Elusimicrobiaceae bacterium]